MRHARHEWCLARPARRACVGAALLGALLATTRAAPALVPPQAQPGLTAASIADPQATLTPREYYVAPNGDDAHAGSFEKPWATVAHGLEQLAAGDTLVLRGGSYFESELTLKTSGAPGAPITIRAHEGEVPVLDGAYPAFLDVPNAAWELVDASRQIFRSTAAYPGAGEIYGYLSPRDGSWALVPYELQGPFGTVNEAYSETAPYYYAGPGTYWDPNDARIYVRTQHGIYMDGPGLAVPIHADARETPMSLFPSGDVLEIDEGVGYVLIEGVHILHGKTALHLDSGAHHVTVRGGLLRGGRYHVLVREGAHDLVFSGLTVDGRFPPWVTWTDVKRPDVGRPAHLLQGSAIHLDGSVASVEITGCTLRGVFDAIGANKAPTGLRVTHNVFTDIRDDVLSLGSAGWDVEFSYNAVKGAHAGVSWTGSGAPPPGKAGTVYVHHNLIDTSVVQRFGRWDPFGLLHAKYKGPAGDGLATGRAFGSHGKDDITGPAPWKIYHNTVIVADDVDNGGAGQAYRPSPFDPVTPHEVYNNVFVQTGDEWLLREARVADGSQIHDGNLYWAPATDSGTELFVDILTGVVENDFATLQDFHGSLAWLATTVYYAPGWESSGVQADPQLGPDGRPAPDGPAASGALDLSAKAWPGLKGEVFRGALAPAGSSD